VQQTANPFRYSRSSAVVNRLVVMMYVASAVSLPQASTQKACGPMMLPGSS
jgi:hypothetical protein